MTNQSSQEPACRMISTALICEEGIRSLPLPVPQLPVPRLPARCQASLPRSTIVWVHKAIEGRALGYVGSRKMAGPRRG